MVLSEIGEDSHVPFDSTRPFLRERVRGNFHRGGTAAGVCNLRKKFLKIERFWRCPRSGKNPLADFVTDRAEQSAAQPGFFANVFDQKGCRGLSVGAGDGREF